MFEQLEQNLPSGLSAMCMFSTSPLRQAIHAKDPAKVAAILESAGQGSADLINEDYTSDCLFNPFMRNVRPVIQTAVLCHNTEIVRLLLDHGADPNMRGPFGEGAIHLAVRYNDVPALRELVTRGGADLYAQDSNGNYAVHTAVHPVFGFDGSKPERLDMMKCLVEEMGKTSDIELKNGAGQTPLHLAASVGNAAICTYLLENGADVNTLDLTGKKPSDVASSHVQHIFSPAH